MYISWKLANEEGYIGQNTGLPIIFRRQQAIIDFFAKIKSRHFKMVDDEFEQLFFSNSIKA